MTPPRPIARAGGYLRARAAALPLRIRLVAGFAVAITVVLSAAGAFVYWRVQVDLDNRLTADITAQAATAQGVWNRDHSPTAAMAALPPEALAQIVDSRGTTLAHTSAATGLILLPVKFLPQARAGLIDIGPGNLLTGGNRRLRVLSLPLPGAAGQPPVLAIVAVRLGQRDEALRELLAQLAVANMTALAIASLVGYRLARAALAPVERYRTQAAQIADGASGVRLDVPAERDDEVTRLGQMLNTMLDALEENVEREKRFTQDASHELRTPLTLLSTRVQLALRRPRSNEALQATLAEIGTDIDALSHLADDLLSLTAATRTDHTDQHLSLSALTDLTRDVLRDHPDVSADELDLNGAPADASVRLGAQQLRQVLTNLIANALTHGSTPVWLSATLHGNGRYLRFTVTDNGPGLPAVFLPQAAQRFARADDARDRPGAGLGLALVHALLDPAGGELRLCVGSTHHRYSHRIGVLCDHPHPGTVATVLLPVARLSDDVQRR